MIYENLAMIIEKAIPSDHQVLSALTKRSKAYWGYSIEQMQLWDEELTLTPDYLKANAAYKSVRNEQTVGFYAYRSLTATLVRLDSLFVSPDAIGSGVGKRLMVHFFEQAKSAGFRKVILDADPNAEGFYACQGFTVVGQKATSIVGRYMPVMEKEL